ncbi:2-C-methyl-D-erythritol 4-phosphate cytidylyltransferase [Bacillus sp. SCS-151]|uniref:2-C-methyl-D-erythritol 4-phosphate cytidylyltransferase n=1 Tax=Nanhaiella sioensis TaxID=3115293 RepID=UPI003979AC56
MLYKVVIPAAGQGKRMNVGMNKLFMSLQSTPIIAHTLKVFENDPHCVGIVLVINSLDEQYMREIVEENNFSKIEKIVYGGDERQHSVHMGLKAVHNVDIVLIHDGARPFIKTEHIHSLVNTAYKDGAAVLAVPVKDTVKRVLDLKVEETFERSSLWAVQTPQAFRISLLEEAHEQAIKDKYIGTDDASLVERLNKQVMIVEGDYQNIKITTPEDIKFAHAILGE